MVKLKVLRPFNFGDRLHGIATREQVGTVIERTEESAAYLLSHDTERPIVEEVGKKKTKAETLA